VPLFRYPSPVLDVEERHLVKRLNHRYQRLTAPRRLGLGIRRAGRSAAQAVRTRLGWRWLDRVEDVARSGEVQAMMGLTAQALETVSRSASRMTIDAKVATRSLGAAGLGVRRFDQICALRSYQIDRVVTSRSATAWLPAASVGAVSGIAGLAGLPVAIVSSLFLAFRCAQDTALHYGYDPTRAPGEMEFAAAVTLLALAPDKLDTDDPVGRILDALMRASTHRELRATLGPARRRGLTVTEGALDRSDPARHWDGLDAVLLHDLATAMGTRVARGIGGRAIPVVGAIAGGLLDGVTLHRVGRVATLVYHKRFLVEKQVRVARLRRSRRRRS